MRAVEDILSSYQHVIDDLRIVTGSKGVFDVKVDGQLIYSKALTGRHAESGEVLAAFAEHVGPIARYGE